MESETLIDVNRLNLTSSEKEGRGAMMGSGPLVKPVAALRDADGDPTLSLPLLVTPPILSPPTPTSSECVTFRLPQAISCNVVFFF